MPSPSEMARELLTLVLWPLRLVAMGTLGRELNMSAVAGRGKHVKDAEDSGGMRVIADYKGSRSSSKNGKGSYGSQAAPGDLPSGIWDKVRTHPCYSEEAHHHYARIHVAVAPACNIQCNYCNRKYDCANESRPGVVTEKLTPEQAARKLLAVATRIPQLTVLGIAGPGDALANPKTTSRATDLRARARHSIRAQRPARPDSAGIGGAAGCL